MEIENKIWAPIPFFTEFKPKLHTYYIDIRQFHPFDMHNKKTLDTLIFNCVLSASLFHSTASVFVTFNQILCTNCVVWSSLSN